MTHVNTIILTLLVSTWANATPVEIIRAIPQGETIEEVRQITLTFNQKMVPLGQMARTAKELGVSVQPEIKCQWRWLDSANLTCQLSDDDQLLAANTYLLTIQPGLKSENGSTLKKPYALRFSTARPKINYTLFQEWRHPSIPRISLIFNQNVDPDSVVNAAAFLVGTKSIRAVRSKSQDKRQTTSNREITLEPETALPPNSSASLRIAAGVISKTGPLRGEASTAIEFDSFPEFEFLGVSCGTYENEGNNTPRTAGDLECSPLGGVALNFSAPVQKEEISGKLKATPPLSAAGKEADVWETVNVYTHHRDAHKRGRRYQVPLPSHLLAQKTYTLNADGVTDIFGRQLSRSLSVSFKTSARPPAVFLPTPLAVLEKHEATDVAVFVTNLQALHIEFQALTAAGIGAPQKRTLQVPKFDDSAFAIPLEARSLLNGGSGFVEGLLTTTPLLQPKSQRFTLQVTPFQVIAKIGYMNSLVWVTDLKSGKNVPGAKIELLLMNDNELQPGEPFSTAQTDKNGVAAVHATTEWPKLSPQNYYAVRVSQGSDFALLPLTYAYSAGGSSPYYYSEGDGEDGGQAVTQNKFLYSKAWGATTQGVYKPGDKVSFKFFLRNQNNRHLVPAPSQDYTLHITNPAGDDVFVKDQITLNAFGAWSGEFQLPATAPVGWYNARIKGANGQHELHVFRFLAADFTPVPFKVETTVNAKVIHPGDTLKIDTLATMHAGGPFAKAPLRLVGIFTAGFFTSDHAKVKDFIFDSSTPAEYSDEVLKVEDQSLDAKGAHQHSLQINPMVHSYGTLMIESAVQDDRGKNSASSARVSYSGLNRRVGLKQTTWLHNRGEKMNLLYAVVDESGAPTRGTEVKIQFEYDRVKVAKVKGAGNAYLSQYEHVWEVAGACSGTSQVEPTRCDFVPKEAGRYRATASINDTRRAAHTVTDHFYVVGAGYVAWESPETEPLEIIPEKKDYKVGEKAKFLVKNPLPGAQALITIERYGILKSWTMVMKDSAVLVEVPIEDDYVPGFNVSVSLTSPRVEKSGPLGAVDLGKPTARFGTFHVSVEDPYKRIQIAVKADNNEYRPRDKVKIKLKAQALHPRKPEEPIELAVVVLDEAVLSLIQGGEKYFDPYKGFYTDSGLNVNTYSLLARLVGRQKFEKKGANSGGGGGLSQDLLLRNLFKFVAYWNPSLKPNANGEAEFEFTVPDNLTGWRVLALAVTPSDRMGLGQMSFKVNKPTELRPVLPNQVTEGDKFRAGFSVLNRTDKARKITVTIQAEGNLKATTAKLAQEFTLDLPPYERKSVFMDVQANTVKEERGGKGEIRFQAFASDKVDKDGLVEKLPVNKRRDFETAAAYGSTTDTKVTENIEFPKDIYPDIGSVSVVLAPSVIGNIEGAFKYLQTYPYLCWEQRLTKGVMASHYLRLKDRLPTTVWPEAKAQVLGMLADAATFQAPSGGMAFWSPLESHVSPYLSAYTAVAFVWLRDAGYKIPSEVERKLHSYLKNYLRNNVETTFFDEGMRSTVRAVALYALVKRKVMGAADVKRYLPAMSQMSLFGQAHYLMAAITAGRAEQEQEKTLKTLLNKSNHTSGKVLFNEKLSDGYWQLLTTPLRDNCSVLSALTAAAQNPALKTKVADLPMRMVRAIAQSRGKRDAFENTQENIFCMQALLDYAKVYEATPPKMQVQVALDGKSFGQTVFNKITEPMKTVERLLQASDVGKKSTVSIERQGQGRLYYATRMTYAPREANSTEVNSGIDVKREYYVERKGQWIQLASPMTVQRGELVKVDIFISLPAARNYLAISDPVPGGLEPVNRDLANDSQVDSNKGGFKAPRGSLYWKFTDWQEFSVDGWSFYHQELRHDHVRFFADYLVAGNYHLTYTAQAIATGEFLAGPTHGEEMYDPDVFGKSKPANFVIQEK